MPLQYPHPGSANSAEFLVSGIPFVTSSTVSATEGTQYDFAFVTQYVTVKNISGGTLYVGFTNNGVSVSSNYFELAATEEERFDVRVTRLVLSASGATNYSMQAGMTRIRADKFLVITGSLTGSDGGMLFEGVG